MRILAEYHFTIGDAIAFAALMACLTVGLIIIAYVASRD